MAVPLPPAPHRRRRRRAVALAATLLGLGLGLAACGTPSGTSSSGASSASAGEGAAAAPAADSAAKGAGSSAGSSGAKTSVLGSSAVKPSIVRTTQVVVQVKGELATAAAKVRAVAESLGGTVSSETTTYEDGGLPQTAPPAAEPSTAADGKAADASQRQVRAGESVLVLRVPAQSAGQALERITGTTGVGKELSRSSSADDVTADLADLTSRVATQRASVARVRALLAQASSLREVVTIEGEVTRRESDLEAAEARRAALADRAALSTITVDLRTPEAVVPTEKPKESNAFLDGLSSGWHAVTASTAVVLTVLGALLPIAVVAVVLGAPVLWLLRRRRPAPPVVGPPAPSASGAAGDAAP